MDQYKILGIDERATIDEVRAAYAKKLKNIDMSKNLKDYQELRKAYNDILKTINNRETYSFQDSTSKPRVVIQKNETVIESNKSTTIKEEISKNVESTTQIDESKRNEKPTQIEIEPLKNKINQIIEEKKKTEVKKRNAKKDPLPKREAPTSHFIEDMTTYLAQKNFYNDGHGWSNLLSPYLNQSEDIKNHVQTVMKVYLIENYSLLDDKTRQEIIKLCELTERNYDTDQDKTIFKKRVVKENYLNYDTFNHVDKNSRNQYFKLRYKFHDYIQVENSHTSIPVTDLNEVASMSYLDDDFIYLNSLCLLLEDAEPKTKEIKLLLAKIHSDKYRHDVEVLSDYLNFLEGKRNFVIASADIISLSWVSEDTKEKIISQMKTFKTKKIVPQQNQKRNTNRIQGKKQVEKQSRKISKMIFSIILVAVALIFIFMNLFDGMNVEETPEINQNIIYRKDERKTREDINYSLFSYLFSTNDELDDSVFISNDALKKIDALKKEYADILDYSEEYPSPKPMGSQYLSDENQLEIYVSFDLLEDFYLKIAVNQKNEIVDVTKVEADSINFQHIGPFDATQYFFEDISEDYHDISLYHESLSQLYETYMTDSLYSDLEDMTEDELDYLDSFGYSLPLVIKPETIETPSFVIANENGEILFIEFNAENKINHLYSDYFENIPDNYLESLETKSPLGFIKNPWYYVIGYKNN
ncbi:hypothetical protein [Vagococcus carniphilus]|uniref:hypothetical protein n=1 Tax=Vagococcus carniphilus TaxID=218144 RepID=UPI00288EFC20|nr:hypothetical protein [Vagococcus carniphilus]MDT2813971.1 hypothetical protein [Vagococcus carniphilus]MDT2864002.1 hypothetical protein [Vagococcus carniphilus]